MRTCVRTYVRTCVSVYMCVYVYMFLTTLAVPTNCVLALLVMCVCVLVCVCVSIMIVQLFVYVCANSADCVWVRACVGCCKQIVRSLSFGRLQTQPVLCDNTVIVSCVCVPFYFPEL